MWCERTLVSFFRTPKYLANLYQASKKAKGKEIETNFIDHDNPIDITYLDVSYFLKIQMVKLTI